MNIRELRIGGLFKYSNKVHRVFGIREMETYKGLAARVDIKCLEPTTPRDSESLVDICELVPIPITEDILLKCGFKKYNMSGYREHFVYCANIGGETFDITALHNADFSIKLHNTARLIGTLHRLQNIIFDITGEKLKIEL